MADQLFNLEPAVIEQSNILADLQQVDQTKVINWGIDLLEGSDIASQIKDFSDKLGVNPSKISKLCSSVSILIWEISKIVTKELPSLPQILSQIGIDERIIPTIVNVMIGYVSERRRLLKLKGALGLDTFSYKDLSWRLDVEISKRSLLNTFNPVYQIRLDLANASQANQSDNSNNNSNENISYHLQADYSNLQMIHQELQRAIDEYNGVHSQRISRYIS